MVRTKGTPERVVQDNLVREAKGLGYFVFHAWLSKNSEPGFPDLLLVHPDSHALIAMECKREDRDTTEAQERWLLALSDAGMAAMVVKPSNLEEAYRILVEKAR